MQPPQTTDKPGQHGSVLIIEDHPLYRDALVLILSQTLGEPRVHAASSVEEGLRLTPPLTDLRLVLLDVGLPGLSGTEAVAAVRTACPDATIVVISASEDRRDVSAAIRAGAQLFVSKGVATEKLAELVRGVMAGDMPAQHGWIAASATTFLEDDLPTLTSRQREILLLLSNGHSNKEIGLRLGLAEVTVKMHVSSIFRALGVTNRTQAVRALRRFGLDTVAAARDEETPVNC